MMNEVIIFGGCHHNTLGVLRSLGRKGINSFVLLHDYLPLEKCFVLKSKYIKGFKRVKDCEEGISYLLSGVESGCNHKPVVICTSDEASSFIDKNYNNLIEYYYIPNCDEQGKVTRLMNKEVMRLQALNLGFDTPITEILEDGNYRGSIPFPCITKPLMSIEGSKADIKICKNQKELVHFLEHSLCKKIQIQQYIDKAFEYQLIGCSLNGGENVIIPGRARIITQPNCTNTGYLHYEKLDGHEPISKCCLFLKEIKYSGLFSIEFLRGKDERNYFMEINFRNDGNSICVTEAGVNLHYIWYAFHANKDWKNEIYNNIKEVNVMPEFTELSLWVQNNISLSRFIREMKDADAFMDYAEDDPQPTKGWWVFRRIFIISLFKKPLVMIKHKLCKH